MEVVTLRGFTIHTFIHTYIHTYMHTYIYSIHTYYKFIIKIGGNITIIKLFLFLILHCLYFLIKLPQFWDPWKTVTCCNDITFMWRELVEDEMWIYSTCMCIKTRRLGNGRVNRVGIEQVDSDKVWME